MTARTAVMALVSFIVLLSTETVRAAPKDDPVTVRCRLKMRYRVLTGSPSIDAIRKYTCEGSVTAPSDVDAVDLTTGQVVFRLDACPRLPATVVFGSQWVTG